MSHPSPQSEKKRHRILVVEDDDLMHALYKSIFRRHKEEFDCEFVKGGGAALECLRRGKTDVVILDWDLSGISGIDLLKAIRANPATKSLRVILVSGRVRTEDQVLALERGADDYLAKPFNVEVLLARLRSLLRR